MVGRNRDTTLGRAVHERLTSCSNKSLIVVTGANITAPPHVGNEKRGIADIVSIRNQFAIYGIGVAIQNNRNRISFGGEKQSCKR